MRIGLVELLVDVTGISAASATEAVRAGIRRDTQRSKTVRTAFDRAKTLGCEVILFPGWTEQAFDPPVWLTTETSGLTVVFECLHPLGNSLSPESTAASKLAKTPSEGKIQTSAQSAAWSTFVFESGDMVVGPSHQRIAEASALWEGKLLSMSALDLIRDLTMYGPSGRRWNCLGEIESCLIICGEANLVGGGGNGGECWLDDRV